MTILSFEDPLRYIEVDALGNLCKSKEMFHQTISGAVTSTTFSFPDPLIDWLPYTYKKYLPTWHLVRSYK